MLQNYFQVINYTFKKKQKEFYNNMNFIWIMMFKNLIKIYVKLMVKQKQQKDSFIVFAEVIMEDFVNIKLMNINLYRILKLFCLKLQCNI